MSDLLFVAILHGGLKMGSKPPTSRLRPNRAIIRFIVVFVILVTSIGLLVQTSWFDQSVMRSYTSFIAWLAGVSLQAMGVDVTVHGTTIVHPKFAVDIRQGCDGLEATLLLVCATLAYPFSSISRRALTLLSGYGLIFALNLVRVVTLFVLGLRGAFRAFDFVHTYIAQFALVTAVMLLWLFWISGDRPSPVETGSRAEAGRTPSASS